MRAPAHYDERRWTSPDGLSLHVRDYPPAGNERGIPVICLHGLTRNGRDFDDVAPLLAGLGRRVLVPDMRGRGQSDWDPDPTRYQPRIYARDVQDMMASSGIERGVFLGTSMGGIITLTLSAIAPARVAAAILNDVGPLVAQAGIARILAYVGRPARQADWTAAADHVRRVLASSYPGFTAEDWHRYAQRSFRQDGGDLIFDYDPAISVPLRPPGRLARWLAVRSFRRLARTRPTLLVRGALSDIIPVDIADKMQGLAPAMQRVDVPGVGHAPLLTEPEAVDAITNFLRTVS